MDFYRLVYLFPNCRSHFQFFVAKFSTEALLQIKIVFERDIEHVLVPDNHTQRFNLYMLLSEYVIL